MTTIIRTMRTHETANVKAALVTAGYTDIKVGHGTGTAWSWLHVKIVATKPQGCTCTSTMNDYGQRETCQLCRAAWREHYSKGGDIVRATTGRHGERENFNVQVELI